MRKLTAVASLAATATALALVVPAATSVAQTAAPAPSLSSLEKQASQLEFQINALSEQYDGLHIQLTSAKNDEKIAEQAAKRDEAALTAGKTAISQLAAESYMGSGLNSTMQMLSSGNPGQFLGQVSTVTALDDSNGQRVNSLTAVEDQDQRAKQTAEQQIANVEAIQKQMSAKKAQIDANIDKVNSAAMSQAMSVYTKTGSYPNITLPTATTIGDQALRDALTKVGDPYVWGAAGSGEFDCSGLVVWAFSQLGIALPHYTGDLWNSGIHVSRNQLEPGDLVFFFADISHVGIYIGNGLMVDAATYGVGVVVQPVFWSGYVGAVRIE
ncbi:MAG TPA: NlpC/P60 family protein [Streptosporangiaceae bacterium]